MTSTDILNQCAHVAQWLWQRQWAERNGGNMVALLPADADTEYRQLPPFSSPTPIGLSVPHLVGRHLYCKGSGCRMRDLARAPMDYGSIIRILPDGEHYIIVASRPILPTSELASHLAIHNYLVASHSPHQATLHTHPHHLIALSHRFPSLSDLSDQLLSMMPETRLFVPRGIGIVPYLEPGSVALAQQTLAQLHHHDIVLWSQHGVLAVGPDMEEAFDTIDIMEKSARILLLSQSR